ncbi:MAG: DUF1207 domain-containing protein [Rubripirellula sp.]
MLRFASVAGKRLMCGVLAAALSFAAGTAAVGDELLGDVANASLQVAIDDPLLFHEAETVLDQVSAQCEHACQCATGAAYSRNPDARDWRYLPDGLLWKSYLAGPQEPRISTVIQYDNDDNIYWDATVGGRVGLVRYGTVGQRDARGWQLDLEGGVITRLNVRESEDVESMDYRFGTEITAAEGAWRMKFGYFHISSHVGDEFIERNPTFKRVNFVTESLVWGVGYLPTKTTRLYGETAWAFSYDGGAKPWQFQMGAEYTPAAKTKRSGAPFAAINLNIRESVDFDIAPTLQGGWGFEGPESGRRWRFGLQYGSGPTSQSQFFENREDYIGIGTWFDY